MYLYVTFDSTISSYTPVGLVPSSRGRAAKNHLGHEFHCDSGTFTHQFAVVSDSELATAVCGEDLKKAVVGAERDAANREFAAAVGPANIMLMLGNAIRRTLVSLLDNTPSAKALPASMLLQLEAVRSALDELLVKQIGRAHV